MCENSRAEQSLQSEVSIAHLKEDRTQIMKCFKEGSTILLTNRDVFLVLHVRAQCGLQRHAARLHLLELESVRPTADRLLDRHDLARQHTVALLLQKRVLGVL